jgi:hypothetical protein
LDVLAVSIGVKVYQVFSEPWRIAGSGKFVLITGLMAVVRRWRREVGELETSSSSSVTDRRDESINLKFVSDCSN